MSPPEGDKPAMSEENQQLRSHVQEIELQTKGAIAHWMSRTISTGSTYAIFTGFWRSTLLTPNALTTLKGDYPDPTASLLDRTTLTVGTWWRQATSLRALVSHRQNLHSLVLQGLFGIPRLLFEDYPAKVIHEGVTTRFVDRNSGLALALEMATEVVFNGDLFFYPIDTLLWRSRLYGSALPGVHGLPIALGLTGDAWQWFFAHNLVSRTVSAGVDLLLGIGEAIHDIIRPPQPMKRRDTWRVFPVLRCAISELVGKAVAFPFLAVWMESLMGGTCPTLSYDELMAARNNMHLLPWRVYAYTCVAETVVRVLVYPLCLQLWYVGTEELTDEDIEVIRQSGPGHAQQG